VVWVAALAIGLAGGFATRGRLDNLVHLRFRWPWFVVAALVVREASVLTPLNRIDGVQYVYAAALAALVAWTVWQIERVRGIWLVTAGAALNLVVIAPTEAVCRSHRDWGTLASVGRTASTP